MTGRAHFGSSGWVYREWRGLFCPQDLRSADWFGYYAQHFDTVEINNSFYRSPTEQAAEGWAKQAPPGFVYALKLGQFGSHRKKLKDPETWLDRHLDRVYRLDAAPRDIRWTVYAVLEKHRAALCIYDVIDARPWIRTTDGTYVRFHGPRATTRAHYGRYGPIRLRKSAERLAHWLDESADAYAYSNNHWHGNAIKDAKSLRTRLADFEAVA